MLKSRQLVLLGLVFFLSFFVIFQPSSSIRLVTNRLPAIDVSATRGSVWNGSGRLHVSEFYAGSLRWSVDPIQLVLGKLAIEWVLEDQTHSFDGSAMIRFGGMALSFDGSVEAETINRILGPYEMNLTGALHLKSIKATVDRNEGQVKIQGNMRWDGGTARYRMSNQRFVRELPALLGELQMAEGIPLMTVRTETDDTPLLQAKLDNDGWIHIGITKRFTQLIGQPWRGVESDHAIVMEVSEKLL
ncbi:MAG: type II secretion system protein N [Pseudomonadota bacterium]|nr:type II secretion system protein N [Pseudomonadota bacterium]